VFVKASRVMGSVPIKHIPQAFLLSAMKMHCYLRVLAARQPLRGDGAGRAAPLVLRAVHATITYTCRLVSNRLDSVAARHGLQLACDVSDQAVWWLGLTAFMRVLARKPTAYREAIIEIERTLAAPCFQRCRQQLADVVSPARSAIFDAILF
jgi:hypothetical protein